MNAAEVAESIRKTANQWLLDGKEISADRLGAIDELDGYIKDCQQLKEIADQVELGNIKEACDLAEKLDTILKDLIQDEDWDFLHERERRVLQKEDIEAIRRLASEGKVKFESELVISDNPDFTITSVKLTGATELEDGLAFDLAWTTKSAGFGHTSFFTKRGKLYCDNETMSKDFVKAVMCKLVDEAFFGGW